MFNLLQVSTECFVPSDFSKRIQSCSTRWLGFYNNLVSLTQNHTPPVHFLISDIWAWRAQAGKSVQTGSPLQLQLLLQGPCWFLCSLDLPLGRTLDQWWPSMESGSCALRPGLPCGGQWSHGQGRCMDRVWRLPAHLQVLSPTWRLSSLCCTLCSGLVPGPFTDDMLI